MHHFLCTIGGGKNDYCSSFAFKNSRVGVFGFGMQQGNTRQ